MDAHRFDALSKALVGGRSRRVVLRIAAAGLVAALGAAPGPAAAGGGCKRLRKKCRADEQCCPGTVCRPFSGCGVAEGAFVCCVALDGPCTESCDCCGTNACDGGRCVVS